MTGKPCVRSHPSRADVEILEDERERGNIEQLSLDGWVPCRSSDRARIAIGLAHHSHRPMSGCTACSKDGAWNLCGRKTQGTGRYDGCRYGEE